MAMYRLSAKVISRSQGRSAVAASAYRAGEKLHNERDGKDYDYSKRHGVLHAEIMMPAGAPARFGDREVFWNAVEAVEKRKDAQLAREVQVALPHELGADDHLELVRDFVQREFVDHGMIADVAIHDAGAKGDHRNVHAHVMLSMRSVSPDGFEGKNRDWNAKDLLEHWREAWADHVNDALERNEVSARVDHRSLEDQREAQVELSREALDMENYERAAVHTAQAEKLNREPRVYLKREDYEHARKDPYSHAGQLLRSSYDMMKQASARAEVLLRDFKELIIDGMDRLDGLLMKLRGGEGTLATAGHAPEKSPQGTPLPSQRHDVQSRDAHQSSWDRLDTALDGLRNASLNFGGREAERAAERQRALEEDMKRREEQARFEAERKAQLEREAEEKRLEQERENTRKYDGPDFSM